MSLPDTAINFNLPMASPVTTTDKELFSMDYLRSFNKAKTDEERFTITYSQLVLLNELSCENEKLTKESKSTDKSKELRLKGNNAFSTERQAAMSLYNESISTAPYPTSVSEGSIELALAFGNRSALYYSMQKYDAALEDVKHALEFGYPDELKMKLFEREAECYKGMGKMDEAASSLQEALNFLPLAKASQTDKLESLTAALQSIKLQASSGTCPDQNTEEKAETIILKKTFGQHPGIPAASDCLRIEHNAQIGRHIVSTRDIKPGDILAIEKPYASVLTPAHYGTHCHNCLKRRDAMIPCQHCTLVMFCSDDCRQSSWALSHWVECPILSLVIRLNMEHEIKLLALRTLIVASRKAGGLRGLHRIVRSLDENVEEQEQTKGFDSYGQYRSSDYGALHFLECHFDKASSPMMCLFAMTAAHIVTYLETCTEFYARNLPPAAADKTEPDWAVFTGVLLMRYMRIAQFNSFRIEEAYISEPTSHRGLCGECLGGGTYNLMSLFNHSCWPNASRFFCDGDTKVLLAQMPIKKGEQIFITYAGDFRKLGAAARRQTQEESFYFRCDCIACNQNWPTYKNLSSNQPTFLCTKCRSVLRPKGKHAKFVKCGKCKRKQSIRSIELKLDVAFKQMQEMTLDISAVASPLPDVTSRLVGLLEELFESVAMPFLPTVDCQELISKSLYRTIGNFYIL